jgi:hypothetical protein
VSLNNLKISGTKHTPEIILNPDGIIKINGRSTFSDCFEFSVQIDEWIDKYICDPADLTCVDFHLEYLPTAAAKIYITLLMKIYTVISKNKKLVVNWYYDEGDIDILEKGEYVSLMTDISFNFIEISDGDISSFNKL